MHTFSHLFIQLAIECKALSFGEFVLKSGRVSPYFFNAGAFSNGLALAKLAECYRLALNASDNGFDMVFGPAYKGIPLAAALACEYAHAEQRDLPWAYDRKEAKDHGEGGVLVGAPLNGRVVIIDDVISAGTSARYATDLIRSSGAEVACVLIALDRQERGQSELSARQQLEQDNIPVVSIATLDDLVHYLDNNPEMLDYRTAMLDYRAKWGI